MEKDQAEALSQKVEALNQRITEIRDSTDQHIAEIRREYADMTRDLREKCDSLNARFAATEAKDQGFGEWFLDLFRETKSDREQAASEGEQPQSAEEVEDDRFIIG